MRGGDFMLPKRLILTALALLIVVACATTPKGRYAQSLDSFDAVMDSYRYYFSMADPATQAEWNAKITPVMRQVSFALDQWKLAQYDIAKEQAYVNLYRQAMVLLIQYGIVEVKQ
jgi:outer membrane lipoprotein-sorting protein